jgi:RNA polymerase sigma-70 factor, ECF subfamily
MIATALHSEPGSMPAQAGTRTVAHGARPGEPTAGTLAGGDADAFIRSLYAEHSASLHAKVYRILADRHHAEEVVQETMLRAWRKADLLTPEQGSVGGWLAKAAYNLAVDRLRAKSARPTEVDEACAGYSRPSLDDHAEDTVNSVFVSRAVAKLNLIHRAVLYEIYFADRTCSEAAVVLGIPVGTVKSRLRHALSTLKNAIGEERP